MAIMENVKKLNAEELEEVNGGAGDGDEPYTPPHCINCGTYDVSVGNGSCTFPNRYYGHCNKCCCEWDLEYYHQSPAAVKGSKSPL